MERNGFGMDALFPARHLYVWLRWNIAAVLCAAGLANPVMADMQVGRCLNRLLKNPTLDVGTGR